MQTILQTSRESLSTSKQSQNAFRENSSFFHHLFSFFTLLWNIMKTIFFGAEGHCIPHPNLTCNFGVSRCGFAAKELAFLAMLKTFLYFFSQKIWYLWIYIRKWLALKKHYLRRFSLTKTWAEYFGWLLPFFSRGMLKLLFDSFRILKLLPFSKELDFLPWFYGFHGSSSLTF